MLFRKEFYGYFKYSQVREWIIIQTHLKNYLMLVIKSIPNQISFENQLCFYVVDKYERNARNKNLFI